MLEIKGNKGNNGNEGKQYNGRVITVITRR